MKMQENLHVSRAAATGWRPGMRPTTARLMQRRSLKFKITLYLALALLVSVFLFSLLLIRSQREAMLQQAVSYVSQLSEVVIKSTRFAMLQNQPSYIDQIIQDVAAQGDIDRVRILGKDGTVIHSSHAPEIGEVIDQEAEACLKCHLSTRGQQQVMEKRSRFFADGEGNRLLGNTEVIRNEPSCSDSSCHAHAGDKQVLGVLDIVYPLREIDRAMQRNTYTLAGFSLGLAVFAGLGVGLFVHRIVYVPLRDLERGARDVSSGNMGQLIPVRSEDEFGQVAHTFNEMTAALRSSQAELQNWAHKLEAAVEEKTRELQIAQAEAVRGEKLASVGLLAAGIAHELNNPLTGILTFSQLVRQKMPDDSPDAQDLDLVIKETKRCANIIRRLLDFAREKTPEKSYCDLNQLITEAAQLIEQPARFDDIEIVLDLEPDLPRAWVDEDLVKQVIMNMLVNARHAIEGQGRITLGTRLCPEPRTPPGAAGPVQMVEISVMDTGCGISAGDLQKIFDPFFTTKGVGKGTGLGLSVSHGAVQAHGGEIQVDSTPGQGSTFRVYLPVGGPQGKEVANHEP
jgi:two-component system NtrC family sensor kinase